MARKSSPKPKLADFERRKRFVAMARDVRASDDTKDFDGTFKKIVPMQRTSTK